MSAVKIKRRSRLKLLQQNLEAIDRERAKLDSIALRKPEGITPQPAPTAPSDLEFWRSYRMRFVMEEQSNCRNLRPRDTLEKMLCEQMAACHRKAMDFVGREGLGEQNAMNQAIRLMRVFSGQVEALKIWRSKGSQTMTIRHVNVNVNGQAVMGEITNTQTGGAKTFEQ